MSIAIVTMPKYHIDQRDDETVLDFGLKVGQRVEIVGFVVLETWLGQRLHAVIVHPEWGGFKEVPAYLLVPDPVAAVIAVGTRA